jgi:hypothetical protein
MSPAAGRRLGLSLPRRLICDLMYFARKVPSVPVQRRMALGAVAAARAAAVPRPSWAAVFTKAYARVAASRPELRRCYLPFPWAHLYEYRDNIATVAVERRFGGEDGVFFVPIKKPEAQTLAAIDDRLRQHKEAPPESLGALRRNLLVARLPGPLRRVLWRVGLYCWPRQRAKFFGTFGVTVYAALGAASLHPLSVLTTTLNYGVIGPDGSVDVRLVYDHRVLDGATVARALADLERVLTEETVAELHALRGADAA